MSHTVYLYPPLTDADVEQLQIGDKVLISGTIYTARDAAHKRLAELLQHGQHLPFDMRGQIVYYVGPSPAKPGTPIGSAGPTTSYRMDPYTPVLLDAGLKGMIGKGPRGQAVIEAMVRNQAVYFAAIGGAGVVMAKAVKAAKIIAYAELGAEAIWELHVEHFPCFVANDVSGNDIYTEAVNRYRIEERQSGKAQLSHS
jgi:fumarate hydratase subunit beta